MMRFTTAVLIGLLMLGGHAPFAGAEAEPGGPTLLEDCQERFVLAPGVEDEVRERVPPQFELRRDQSGRPLLFVTAIRCERYTAGGTTQATTAAAFAASIESPDGVACATRWPAVGAVAPDAPGSCSFYLLFAAYDNPDVVAWARRGTPHVPVQHVEDLVFTQDGLDPTRLGAPFSFSSPSTPSPYELDLVVRERPAELPLTGSFWHSGPAGTVRFRFESDALAFGEASGTVRTEPGSDMATLFGTDEPTPANGFPLLAGNRWAHGTMSKTVFRPPLAEANPPGGDGDGPTVVERAVEFDVANLNRSATSELCSGDGATYTIRGSLVGPAGVQAGGLDAVTVYVHGSGDASTWHFTPVPDVDHITEMAKLGQASVFVHLLGYGSSDPVDGLDVCIGAYADHVRQVIEQLRAGTYTMAGGPEPAFERVALAGHSSGAMIAQLTAMSFRSADALVVAGWSDSGWGYSLADDLDPLLPFYGTMPDFARRCLTEPESKQPDGPGNWAYLFRSDAEFAMLVHDVDAEVWTAFKELYEQDPCGWGDDMPAAMASNFTHAATVDIPVLLANGDRDPVNPPATIEVQRARYELGSDDVASLLVPDTAHQIMLERNASTFRAGLSAWLRDRGF